jgi:hypothetical protein
MRHTEAESACGLGTDDPRSQQARGSVATATVATLATVGAAGNLRTQAREPLVSGLIEWTSKKSPLRLAG